MISHFRLIDLKKILKSVKLNTIGQKGELHARLADWTKQQKRFPPTLMEKVRECFTNCPTSGNQDTTPFKPLINNGIGPTPAQISSLPTSYNKTMQSTNNVVNLTDTNFSSSSTRRTGVAGKNPPLPPTVFGSSAFQGECCSKEQSDQLLKTDYIHNPFFTQRYFITKPKPLVPAQRTSTKRSYQFSIRIPFDWYQKISSKDEKYDVLLRIYEMKQAHKDYLPHEIKLLVNGHEIKLPNMIPASHAGVKPRCQPKPLVITSRIRSRTFADSQKPNFCDMIQINWYHCDGTKGKATPPMSYVVSIVRTHNCEEAAQRIQRLKRPRAVNASLDLLKKKANNSLQAGLEQTAQKMLLVCPIMMTPIKMPVRFDNCQHMDCFDATNYLRMNFAKPAWSCPICNKHFAYGTLRVDLWFEKLLKDAGTGTREVELDNTGGFIVTEKDEESESDSEEERLMNGGKPRAIEADAVVLDDDDDNDKISSKGGEITDDKEKNLKDKEAGSKRKQTSVICLDSDSDGDSNNQPPNKKSAPTKTKQTEPKSKPKTTTSTAPPLPGNGFKAKYTSWRPRQSESTETELKNVARGWSANPFSTGISDENKHTLNNAPAIHVQAPSKRQHNNAVPTHSLIAPTQAKTGYSDFTKGPSLYSENSRNSHNNNFLGNAVQNGIKMGFGKNGNQNSQPQNFNSSGPPSDWSDANQGSYNGNNMSSGWSSGPPKDQRDDRSSYYRNDRSDRGYRNDSYRRNERYDRYNDNRR